MLRYSSKKPLATMSTTKFGRTGAAELVPYYSTNDHGKDAPLRIQVTKPDVEAVLRVRVPEAI